MIYAILSRNLLWEFTHFFHRLKNRIPQTLSFFGCMLVTTSCANSMCFFSDLVRLVATIHIILPPEHVNFCISVLFLRSFSVSPLPALWREKSYPQLLTKSGWWDWGKMIRRWTLERQMKTVLVLLKKNGTKMPAWIPSTMRPHWQGFSRETNISGHQQEKEPNLTWQELGKEPQPTGRLETRLSIFQGQGREGHSIWPGLEKGTSPT